MLKTCLPVVCLAGIILTTLTALNAQAVNPAVTVPRTVRHTGSFHPAAGGALQAVESVTLAIYSEQSGGDPLWQETQNVQVDASGNFAVEIGATQNDGLPLDLLRTAEPRWLGVRLNRAGEAELPRVQLLSVPYALRAADAETLGGKPASAYLLAAGVEATTASATATTTSASVTATGSSNAARTLKPRATSGSAGFLGRFINGTDLGNSVVFDTGSRVGIGSTLPYDLLHVRFTDTSGGVTGLAVQNMGSGAASYSGMLFYDQNGALGQFQGFNNSTHEYRINNIASGGSINFMLETSKFQVRSDGDIDIAGSIRKGGSLFLHNLGTNNTALGLGALYANTTGGANTANGEQALFKNTTGDSDTALGSAALYANTAGTANTGTGYLALTSNTTGGLNTAVGATSMFTNTTGSNNIAAGAGALLNNTTGSTNAALGYQAGFNLVAGSYNIMIGNQGTSTDDHAIRMGDVQTRTFIAGIRGVTTGSADAVAVVIDSNGQLGTVNSSRRFKEDIEDMGERSSNLLRLRPVTYRYKQPYADGSKPRDYGLLAEEVAELYPDLVVRNTDGQVETVQYQKLAPMLLNELQKQHEQIRKLEAELSKLKVLLLGKANQ